MAKLNPEAISKRILHSGSFRWTILLLTIMIAGSALIAAMAGTFQNSGQLASVAAAFATILLVSLTSQYAEQTRELVEENQRDRELRREERESDRTRELDSLRRALHEEIGKVAYFDDLSKEYEVSNSIIGVATTSTIYESNASKIGLLTDEEVDYIVEYYTRLDRVCEFIELQKELDTLVGKGPAEEWFILTEAMQRAIVRKLTFGYFGAEPSTKRVKVIKEQLEELSRVQENALEALRRNLDAMN